MDDDSMINNIGPGTVPLDGMKMNVEEPILVLGIEDKASQLKKSEIICRNEEKKDNYQKEVKNDGILKEEVNMEERNEEDPEEEAGNDENEKEDVGIEEYYEEDPEEESWNDENENEEVISEEIYEDDSEEEAMSDENKKEEVSIEGKNEEPEEEVRNDENCKEEMIIEENYEDSPDEEVKNEDTTNDAVSEGKLKAISKKKVSKLRKTTKIHKEKSIGWRNKAKNAVVSTSKVDEDGLVGNVGTKMISLPMLDKSCKIREVRNEENAKEESQNERDLRNEAQEKERLEANSKKRAKKEKSKEKDLRGKKEVVVNNRENPESSKKKTTMKEKCTGMIFMCNSKTKMDCYNYQVLGLPANKRDIVFEIYEGMKLFLYDFDLKLMYGIYEASGPGGYNIEPKAFSSAFPAQVRFAVLEDCLPLAEEKFKKTIKDNYYSKTKFDCQLNSKQVENLCELFRVSSIGSTFKQLNGSQNAKATAFLDHGPKRPPRGLKAKRPQAEAPAYVDRKSKRSRRRRKAESLRAEAHRPVDHEPKQSRRNKAESLRAEAHRPVDHEPKQSRRSKDESLRAEALRPVGHEPKQPRRIRKPEIPRAEASRRVDREPKQPRRNREPEIRRAEAPAVLNRKAKRSRRRKAEPRPFGEPEPKRLRRSLREEPQNFLYGDRRDPGRVDERHRALARDHLYPEDLVASRREVYEPSLEYPPPRQPLHLPLASSLLPSTERDVYGRDRLHYREVPPLEVDLRRQDEFDYRSSYINPLQQDDLNHRGSYLASRRHSSFYDPSSSAAQQSGYYNLASRGPVPSVHLPAAPPPDYLPYRPGYRYYP